MMIGKVNKKPARKSKFILLLGNLDLITKRFFFAFKDAGGPVPIRAAFLSYLSGIGGTATQFQLCERLYRTPNSISSLSRSLEKEGLVWREQNANDRKYVQVTLTPKGERLAREQDTLAEEIIKEIFISLREEEIDLIVEKLTKVADDQVAKYGRRIGWFQKPK